MHVLCLTADERLIDFNRSLAASHLPIRVYGQAQPDPMQHEPRSLLCHANCAMQFIAGYAVFAVGQKPHGREPFIETDGGVFEDRADLERELLPGMLGVAIVQTRLFEVGDLFRAASRTAHDSIQPTKLDHELAAVLRIAKVLNRLL